MMIGLVALTLQAAASAASVDHRASKWGVEYAPNQCIINRKFGDGTKPTLLLIDAGPFAASGDLILLASEPGWQGTSGTATVTLAPGDVASPAPWSAGPGKQGEYYFKLSLNHDQWQRVKTAESLSINTGSGSPVLVPVKGLDKAFAAAQTCGQEMIRAWGADPDAKIDEASWLSHDWLSPDAYPADAFRHRQQGRVGIFATVDASGKPLACRVVKSSGVPSLDEATCQAFMRRARFTPSDHKGRYLFTFANWVNPN